MDDFICAIGQIIVVFLGEAQMRLVEERLNNPERGLFLRPHAEPVQQLCNSCLRTQLFIGPGEQ